MRTKFDIGEEVLIKGIIEGFCADKNGVRYRVRVISDGDTSWWILPTFKEDELERRVQQ